MPAAVASVDGEQVVGGGVAVAARGDGGGGDADSGDAGRGAVEPGHCMAMIMAVQHKLGADDVQKTAEELRPA